MSSIDERIPIRLGAAASAGPGSQVVISPEKMHLPLSHIAGCLCCPARGPLARTLSRLFFARARGEVPYFREVVLVGDAGVAEVEAAIREDVLVSARFRLSPNSSSTSKR